MADTPRPEGRGWRLNQNGEWVRPLEPDSLAPRMEREDGSTYSSFINPAGNRCFVATSAFENQDHPVVDSLRQYRDEVLAHNLVGRAVNAAYYDMHLGEVGAKVLDHFSGLKPLVRTGLEKLVDRFVNPALASKSIDAQGTYRK